MPLPNVIPRFVCFPVSVLLLGLSSLSLAQQSAPDANPTTPPATATPAATSEAYTADYLKWGSPRTVVAPDYPKALLEKQQGGIVDLVVEISAAGKVQKVVSISSEPAQPLLEASVQDVLLSWMFNRSMGPDCTPVVARSRVKVWFELKEGKPVISVSHVPAPLSPGAYRLDEINRAEVVQLVSSNYPRQARIDSNVADVLAKLTVEARSGIVKVVDITAVFSNAKGRRDYSSSIKAGSRSPAVTELFAAGAQDGLMATRFKPLPDPKQELVQVCREVNFRLSGMSED